MTADGVYAIPYLIVPLLGFVTNTSNILVCNSAIQEMSYEQGVLDNYKLKVSFPADYDSEDYAQIRG